jgi:hypothetical protein
MEPGKWYKVRKKPVAAKAMKMDVLFKCGTSEGMLQGKIGDILVLDVDGEPYPCDPETFEKTYDVIGEEDDND